MNTDKRNGFTNNTHEKEENILTTGCTGSTGKEKEKFDPLIALICTDAVPDQIGDQHRFFRRGAACYGRPGKHA